MPFEGFWLFNLSEICSAVNENASKMIKNKHHVNDAAYYNLQLEVSMMSLVT